MKNVGKYIIIAIFCSLQNNAYTQCPGGASWFNTPVNGTLKDSGRIQVLDTVNVSSTNPTAGSFAAGRPIYGTNTPTWAGYPYESIRVIRGGGIGASTTFKLKIPADSNTVHFIVSDVRGDGFNAETQRILGYNNGVLVSATANDAINGATFTGGNTISGGASTTGAVQSSIRIFFNGPVDSVVIRSISLNDYVITELAARCDVILPVYKVELSAKTISNSVQLKWKITGEADVVEIERSGDKNNWTLLKSLAGNLSQFYDINPLHETSYYRIKAIEPSGNARYSDIVQVKHTPEKNTGILIYPNPFKDNIRFSSVDKIISYRLTSATGTTILFKKFTAVNSFTENLPPSISSGLYYVTLFLQNGEQRTYKLFKD